jgi:hypothetical protein
MAAAYWLESFRYGPNERVVPVGEKMRAPADFVGAKAAARATLREHLRKETEAMAVRVLDGDGKEVYRWTVLQEMNLNRSQVLQAAQKEMKKRGLRPK